MFDANVILVLLKLSGWSVYLYFQQLLIHKKKKHYFVYCISPRDQYLLLSTTTELACPEVQSSENAKGICRPTYKTKISNQTFIFLSKDLWAEHRATSLHEELHVSKAWNLSWNITNQEGQYIRADGIPLCLCSIRISSGGSEASNTAPIQCSQGATYWYC